MTHEFKKIIKAYLNARHLGLSCVTATVVDLKGSSYRRPGVRMLINEHGLMTGAVSGGCVEKEILKQSHSVFQSGVPKMISYDGRYRLGCEGTLHILIERFSPEPLMIEALEKCLKERNNFKIESHYENVYGENKSWGSRVIFDADTVYAFHASRDDSADASSDPKIFIQKLKPCFKIVIIGAEHDAAQLSLTASHLGWEVTVVTSPSNSSELTDFPGADVLVKKSPEELNLGKLDREVAIVLMTHSYVKDLHYLQALINTNPAYIGLLGPSNRRERILNDLIEKEPSVDEELFQIIFGPAGLNIGAETPEEIAMSICSEILSQVRQEEPKSLKDKSGPIHHSIRL